MTLPGGESLPITNGRTFLHSGGEEYWHEVRFHRGRVVLCKYGTVNHEVRIKPDDLCAPVWIARPRAEALAR